MKWGHCYLLVTGVATLTLSLILTAGVPGVDAKIECHYCGIRQLCSLPYEENKVVYSSGDVTFAQPSLGLRFLSLCTNIKSMMNSKLNLQKFWPCHKKQDHSTIPHIQQYIMCEFLVEFPLTFDYASPGLSITTVRELK